MKFKQNLLTIILIIALLAGSFLLGQNLVKKTQKADAANVAHTFAKRIGGTGNDYAHSTGLDSSANIFLGGAFESTVDFDPGSGTANLTSAGSADIYVAKLDSSGNYVSAKRIGSTGYDSIAGMVIDSSGNVYNGWRRFVPGPNNTTRNHTCTHADPTNCTNWYYARTSYPSFHGPKIFRSNLRSCLHQQSR